MHVKEIESFLKKYGLPSPDDDQGAASLDLLDFADAADADFESYSRPLT
jgi:hypothetical protein